MKLNQDYLSLDQAVAATMALRKEERGPQALKFTSEYHIVLHSTKKKENALCEGHWEENSGDVFKLSAVICRSSGFKICSHMLKPC